MEKLISKQRMAELLGTSPNLLWEMVEQELIPYHIVGQRVKFLRSEVLEATAKLDLPPKGKRVAGKE